MKRPRPEFDEQFARTIYLANQSGLSFNELVRNPNYNTKQVSMQRLQQIASSYKSKLQRGEVSL